MSSRAVPTELTEVDVGDGDASPLLPTRYSLTIVSVFSLLIALLAAVTSVAGLAFQENIYPTVDLQQSFMANDVVNLLIGLPILLGSVWLARRGVIKS